jgi:hypothetical protein
MSPDLTSNSFDTTVSGLTRLLVIMLFAPGVVAGALVAGALALCLFPVLLLVNPGRRGGFWVPPFMFLRSLAGARRSAAR